MILIPLSDTKHADKIVTKEGNTYYRWPQWFKELPGGNLERCSEMPEDLSTHICKVGLGSEGYEIKRGEK